MDREHHLKRLGFRAWHRGTREADYMIGGFFDRYAAEWSDEEVAWFERLIEQEDVDIMAWAMGKEPTPAAFDGPLMRTMQKLDYISIH